MNTVDLGSEKEVLPRTSKYVEVVVLLSGEPKNTPDLKKKAVSLKIVNKNQVLIFTPANIEVKQQHDKENHY